MKKLIIIVVLIAFIASCGHMANPAPPKVEVQTNKDKMMTCDEIISEINTMQQKRTSTQKQIDTQLAQNIISGIGGWALLVPFIFIDPTTSKNESYNSYKDREEYLREIAIEKKCENIPAEYQYLKPSDQKQTALFPSGGNVVQSTPKTIPPTKLTSEGYKVWEITGKGMCEDWKCEPDNRPIMGKDISYGDHYSIDATSFKVVESGKWKESNERRRYVYQVTKNFNPSGKSGPLAVRAPDGTKITVTMYENLITRLKDENINAPSGEYKWNVIGKGSSISPDGTPVVLKDIFNGDEVTIKGKSFTVMGRGSFTNEFTWVATPTPKVPGAIDTKGFVVAEEGIELEIIVKRTKSWTKDNVSEMFTNPF
jgi:hypothetical protein